MFHNRRQNIPIKNKMDAVDFSHGLLKESAMHFKYTDISRNLISNTINKHRKYFYLYSSKFSKF